MSGPKKFKLDPNYSNGNNDSSTRGRSPDSRSSAGPFRLRYSQPTHLSRFSPYYLGRERRNPLNVPLIRGQRVDFVSNRLSRTVNYGHGSGDRDILSSTALSQTAQGIIETLGDCNPVVNGTKRRIDEDNLASGSESVPGTGGPALQKRLNRSRSTGPPRRCSSLLMQDPNPDNQNRPIAVRRFRIPILVDEATNTERPRQSKCDAECQTSIPESSSPESGSHKDTSITSMASITTGQTPTWYGLIREDEEDSDCDDNDDDEGCSSKLTFSSFWPPEAFTEYFSDQENDEVESQKESTFQQELELIGGNEESTSAETQMTKDTAQETSIQEPLITGMEDGECSENMEDLESCEDKQPNVDSASSPIPSATKFPSPGPQDDPSSCRAECSANNELISAEGASFKEENLIPTNTYGGRWRCNTCLIKNNSTSETCACCHEKKPEPEPPSTSTVTPAPVSNPMIENPQASVKFEAPAPLGSASSTLTISQVPEETSSPVSETTSITLTRYITIPSFGIAADPSTSTSTATSSKPPSPTTTTAPNPFTSCSLAQPTISSPPLPPFGPPATETTSAKDPNVSTSSELSNSALRVNSEPSDHPAPEPEQVGSSSSLGEAPKSFGQPTSKSTSFLDPGQLASTRSANGDSSQQAPTAGFSGTGGGFNFNTGNQTTTSGSTQVSMWPSAAATTTQCSQQVAWSNPNLPQQVAPAAPSFGYGNSIPKPSPIPFGQMSNTQPQPPPLFTVGRSDTAPTNPFTVPAPAPSVYNPMQFPYPANPAPSMGAPSNESNEMMICYPNPAAPNVQWQPTNFTPAINFTAPPPGVFQFGSNNSSSIQPAAPPPSTMQSDRPILRGHRRLANKRSCNPYKKSRSDF